MDMSQLSTGTEFFDQEFKGVTVENEILRNKEFYDCTFSNCSFRETKFVNCKFNNITFVDCDLSLISVVGCSFRDTRFERSTLIGVNWTVVNWPEFSQQSQIGFFECTVDYSTFIGLTLEKISFRKCSAKDVDFSEAVLSQADFSGALLAQTQFRNTNLTKANFEGATEYQIDVMKNNVAQARFSMPEAISLLYALEIVVLD
jgi:uncharacterized protein YjbI with pentapeptide repeats